MNYAYDYGRYDEDYYSEDYYNGNYAENYLESYEESYEEQYQMPQRPPITVQRTQRHEEVKPQQRGSAVSIFLCATMLFAMLAYMMYEKSETSKMYNQVARASARLDVLTTDNKRMNSELEAQMALKNVEEYAENVLGLRKLDQSQIEYVMVYDDSFVEIAEEEVGVLGGFKKTMEKVLEYIFS
jgi:hypothetical protein